jgi:hypothetical protein
MRLQLLILISILSFSAGSAQLLNSTVNVSPYYPDVNTQYLDAGNVTVTGAQEYPIGSYSGYKAGCGIDVTDTQIIIGGAGTFFLNASFNGWVLEVINGVNILGASVDPMSDNSPVVTFTNNRVEINFQGLTIADNSTTIINVSSEPTGAQVPTLSQWGLLILGLSVLIFGIVAIRQYQFRIA